MARRSVRDTDHILLSDLSFYGYHGVREEERRLGQRFTLDLVLGLDLRPAGQTDRLDETVDYSRVYHVVRAVVEGPSRQLIEALAEAVAAELLDSFPRLEQVTVRVKKPWAPISASHIGFVAVEITRARGTGA